MSGASLSLFVEPAIIAALLLVSVAAISDVVSGQIPNKITYTGFIIGIGFGLWPALAPSIVSCLLGIGLAFIPGFLLFAIGSVGGGDVKLITALGAFLGSPLILDALFYSILVGAGLAFVLLIWKGRLTEMLKGLFGLLWALVHPGAAKQVPVQDLKVPMGLAVALGTFWVTLVPGYRISGLIFG